MGIKASELRIGNYVDIINRSNEVHLPLGVIKQVGQIGFSQTAVYELGNFAVLTSHQIVENRDLLSIKLTEDLAKRLGLKEHKVDSNFSFWHIGVNPLTKDWLFCLSKHKDDDYFFFQNAYHKIMYVHHAQNLAYDLAGLELTFKND